jgi:hypothetical protein
MSTHRTFLLAGAFAAALLLAQSAAAGPPLICHPFVTGNDDALLPWGKGTHNWDLRDSSYDVAALTADTLALLSADAPMFARMENMRRATIYASAHQETATELLRTVLARAEAAPQHTRTAALAWFDAGYLVETYRQMGQIDGANLQRAVEKENRGPLDGYALLRKAQALAPELTAEMEFAASLMMTNAAGAAEHRGRAAAGAQPGSLLALNLAR